MTPRVLAPRDPVERAVLIAGALVVFVLGILIMTLCRVVIPIPWLNSNRDEDGVSLFHW